MEDEAAEASTRDAECEGRKGVFGRVSFNGRGTSISLAGFNARGTAEALAGSFGELCGSGDCDCEVSASYSACMSDSGWRAGTGAGVLFTTTATWAGGAVVRLGERSVSTETCVGTVGRAG